MCGNFEVGSYVRLIDSCITQLKAQEPSRTCESNEAEEGESGYGMDGPTSGIDRGYARALATEIKVESETSQRKSGIPVHLKHSRLLARAQGTGRIRHCLSDC